MAELRDALTDESKRQAVVKDCVDIVDAEVADKRGMGGMAIKAGYAAVKGIKPGFIAKVVNDLLPEFAEALDPIYLEAKEKGEPVAPYFERNSGRVAEALLAITDGKAERSDRGVVKNTYKRLRPSAKQNVEAAIPRLGKLVEKYAP